MIKYTFGDILKSDSVAIVNTVNCEGYMGKGIAYQFKLRFPENNEAYVEACRTGEFKIGSLLTFQEDDKFIINFPTKDKWRKKSEYSFIEIGLQELVKLIRQNHFESIAIPPLGCGNGGLDWNEVRQLLEKFLEPVSDKCEITIYQPHPNNASKDSLSPKNPPAINTSHLLLMYLKMGLKKFNRLRIQKAAYLVNILSGKNYFKFDKNHFGPHAYSIEILSREIREYQNFYNVTTLDAIDRYFNTLVSDSVTLKLDGYLPYVDQVTEIVNNFEKDSDLELFTTLIFLVQKHKEMSLEELVQEVHNWNEHKRNLFDELAISTMLTLLQKMGLLKINLLSKYELSAA